MIIELELVAKKDVMNHDILRPSCKLHNFINLVENKRCSISGGLLDMKYFNQILDEMKDHYLIDEITIFCDIDEPTVQFLGAKIFTKIPNSRYLLTSIAEGMNNSPRKIDYINFQFELIDKGLEQMAIYDPTYAKDFRKLHDRINKPIK